MSFDDLNFNFGDDEPSSQGNTEFNFDTLSNSSFDDETPTDNDTDSNKEGSLEDNENVSDENQDTNEETTDVEQEAPEVGESDVEGDIESLDSEEFNDDIYDEQGMDDEEFQRLLGALETEIGKEDSDEDVMMNIVNDLRVSLSEKDDEIAFYKKQAERYQQRDLERADSDIEFGMAKPMIEKVNNNPKLKQLIHFSGNEDEVAKGKFADVLADLYEQATGISIATLIEKEQQAGMGSAFAKNSSNSMSFKDNSRDDEEEEYYNKEDRNSSFFD